MNQLVLSRTATLVLSGTRSSCYRGPESSLSACFPALSSRSNFTNQKSFGFLLTDQTESRVGGARQRQSDSPACLCRPYTFSTELQAHGSPAPASGSGGMSDLTEVEVLWLEKRIENRIRFGRIVKERKLDRHRRVLSFAPGSIFAFVRWTSNDFGTIISRIDILRAVAPGQRCSTVPYVTPGGEILLRLSGWPKVERVLQMTDAVEALGIDPADVAPDHWHHVHNRLSVNENPRPYTKARHQAWLHRQKVMR